MPPGAIADLVVHSLQHYPNATVTDVGSVKAGVLDTLWQRDVELSRYVGSHPMAGSHHSGPVTAHPGLFVDRTWVVTPHRRSAPESVAQVQAAVQACGAREVIMDVDDHDAAVARVSHLPHLMSVLVAAHVTRASEPDLLLAGQGLRDVTRIAGSDPLLWEQIVGANSNAVLEELRSIQDQLGLLIKAVEAAPATDELRTQLERGVAGTQKIGGKHGAAAVRYSEVVVAIPDSPGRRATCRRRRCGGERGRHLHRARPGPRSWLSRFVGDTGPRGCAGRDDVVAWLGSLLASGRYAEARV